jgi:hypothetical protein
MKKRGGRNKTTVNGSLPLFQQWKEAKRIYALSDDHILKGLELKLAPAKLGKLRTPQDRYFGRTIPQLIDKAHFQAFRTKKPLTTKRLGVLEEEENRRRQEEKKQRKLYNIERQKFLRSRAAWKRQRKAPVGDESL